MNKIVDKHASMLLTLIMPMLSRNPWIFSTQLNDVRMNAELLHSIEENRHILKCCAESILYCGHQCIALRGDIEKRDHPGNPGNLMAMLKLIANHDPILKNHLEHPRQRNATYISPYTQNEIIDIIGKRII